MFSLATISVPISIESGTFIYFTAIGIHQHSWSEEKKKECVPFLLWFLFCFGHLISLSGIEFVCVEWNVLSHAAHRTSHVRYMHIFREMKFISFYRIRLSPPFRRLVERNSEERKYRKISNRSQA